LVSKKKLRKEISRQGYVTFAEHFQIEAQGEWLQVWKLDVR
jgi:hypothetical protein